MNVTRTASVSCLPLLCVAGLAVEAAPPDKAPPPAPFRKVSELVKLSDFLPGMGTFFVDPTTLPAGPFLAYDHGGRLVSTIYMVPLKDFNEHKKLAGLGAEDAMVDHVDMYFNAGHYCATIWMRKSDNQGENL
jgi:hypothetical protein